MKRKTQTYLTLIVVTVCMLPWPNVAESHVLGWLEWSWIQPEGIKIKTKLDTGAKTSSIDAVDIEKFERDNDSWVRFTIPLARRTDDSDHGKDIIMESPLLRIVKIKDHENEAAARYVVNLTLCIGGQTLTTPVSLANRRRFNYPLLLGRSTLENKALVDPAKTFTASKSCDGELTK